VNDTVDRIFEAHLTVRNIALSMACYRDRLGLEVAHVSPERVAFLWAGGRGRTMLGLWAASAAPQHVTNHIAFATTLADVINAPTSLERSGIGACGTRAKERDDGRPEAPIRHRAASWADARLCRDGMLTVKEGPGVSQSPSRPARRPSHREQGQRAGSPEP